MKSRSVALALGVVYAALTVLELVFADDWTVGDATIIERTTRANLLHWATALGLLGSYFAGRGAARTACRIVGPIFLVLAVWGLLSASSQGSVFGYQEGLPVTYQVLNALTAAAAIAGGFVRERDPA